eukprot:8471597-Prorocentrum_lima.AAC.1
MTSSLVGSEMCIRDRPCMLECDSPSRSGLTLLQMAAGVFAGSRMPALGPLDVPASPRAVEDDES